MGSFKIQPIAAKGSRGVDVVETVERMRYEEGEGEGVWKVIGKGSNKVRGERRGGEECWGTTNPVCAIVFLTPTSTHTLTHTYQSTELSESKAQARS